MKPPKSNRSVLSAFWLPGVVALGLIAVFVLLSLYVFDSGFRAEPYVYSGFFIAYLAIIVGALTFREGLKFSLNELFVWGNGLILFACLVFVRSIIGALHIDSGSEAADFSAAFGLDLAAVALFSFYVLIGSFISFKYKPNRFFVVFTTFALVLVTAVYLLNSLNTNFVVGNKSTTLTKLLYLFSGVLMLASGGILIARKVKQLGASSKWLITGFWVGGFAALFHARSETIGDSFFWTGHVLLALLVTEIMIGFFAHKNRRLSVNQRLSDVLQTGYDDMILSQYALFEMVENMSDGVVISDLAHTIRFSNSRFAEMLNYEMGSVAGLHLSVFLQTEDFEKLKIDTAKPTESFTKEIELELRKKDNQTIPVAVSVVSIYSDLGVHSGSQFLVHDLSERRRIEKEFRRLVKEKTDHLDLFRECIEHSTEGIMITDINGEIHYANSSFEQMTGFTQTELEGQETKMLALDSNSVELHKEIWNAAKVGKIWRGELKTKKRDGSGFICALSVVPIENDSMPTKNCFWIHQDVTRRKMLERNLKNYAEKLTRKTEELESSKAYYGSLISAMSDILIVVDNENNCTFINSYGKKRLGFDAQGLAKSHLPVFFDDLKRLESDYGQAIQIEIKDFECEIKPKQGDAILCSWYAKPLFNRFDKRLGAMAVGRDITEYKKMQNELQDYAKNLEKSVEERTMELETKLTQLGKLLEIGEEIRLNGDVDVIINKICDAVQALGWSKVVISLRDYEKQVSQPVATAGLKPDQVEKVMNWRDIPFSHTDKYFKDHFRISNSYFIPSEEGFVTPKTRYSIHSSLDARASKEWSSLDALLVPIRTKDKVLGTISVDHPMSKKRPGFDEIRDLEIFADKAAIAIENVRLFQVQRQNEREAKFLADISNIFHASLNLNEVLQAVVDKGGTTIGEFCSLLISKDEENVLMPEATYHRNVKVVELFVKGNEEFPCNFNEGIVGSVVMTGKACRLSQPFQDKEFGFQNTFLHYVEEFSAISSLMVVPLKVPGKIIGAMLYVLFDKKRGYRAEELRLSQELASRAALAIDNARLFAETGLKAAELEKANRMKSEFLANVSHELRTPLNAIIALSDIQLRSVKQFEQVEQDKQLAIINRSGHNLLNLINDILDLSKIEAGKIVPYYTTIPLGPIVEEMLEHIRPLCTKKNLSLEHDFDKNLPNEIYTDQDKLTKAITNVLSNAVKFTESGGITVKMYAENKAIIIKITDTGIGIPEDRLHEIFHEFHQIDSTDSRSYGGTGLGLAITKRVLEILGGAVAVESEQGKGSTFTIAFPLKNKQEGFAKRPGSSKIKNGKVKPAQLDMSDDRKKLTSDNLTLLVIDDEPEIRHLVKQYVDLHDYQLVIAENNEDALQLAKQYTPAAILLDIVMPGKSGWEILKNLQQDMTTRTIPVVMTSVLREETRAMELGASYYLKKPFTREELLDILRKIKVDRKSRQTRFEIPRLLSNLRKSRKENVNNRLSALGKNDQKILLVDDDKDTQYAMKLILEGAGYHVDSAKEGFEALQKAGETKPNLILMDIMMPGMDGYEATRRLRLDENFRKVPIVAMTAKAMKGDREKTIEAGCDDYIAKPFVIEDVLKLISKWLANGI